MMYVRRRRHFMDQGALAPTLFCMHPSGRDPAQLSGPLSRDDGGRGPLPPQPKVAPRLGWARPAVDANQQAKAPAHKPPPLAASLHTFGHPSPMAGADGYNPPPPGAGAVNPLLGGNLPPPPLRPTQAPGGGSR